jgi:mono/diheme cytochrome c family protein
MRSLVLLGVLSALAASRAGAQAPDGKALFDANCAKCHGSTGRPSPAIKRMFPEIPLYGESFFAVRSEADIIAVLTNGKGKNMKPWKDHLTSDEMTAVARYIRTLRP